MTKVELDELAKAIMALSDADRSYLWGWLSVKLCMSCGDNTGGATCWGCYESREYPDE